MCGLVGWFGLREKLPQPETLRSMANAIAHRGPDGEGFYITTANDRQVALGHRRLAIIDPAGGKQPMFDKEAGLVLVFNGEIYNYRELRGQLIAKGYRFETDSDTEVLLRAWREWGEHMLERMRGMFAFVLWDSSAQQLFMARDAFGKKPLFLMWQGEQLYFASEIKALQQLPRFSSNLDRQALWDYLVYRYVPAPLTLFKGVTKLMPGTCLTWKGGQWHTRQWFSPPDCQESTGRLPVDPVSGFRQQLDLAVERRMISDVPFGAFLSGGIDSSAIVALMSQHSQQAVQTFSVGFKEAQYSELGYAKIVAKHFATHHHELLVSARQVIDLLPKMVQLRDAPVAEPSDIPIYLLSCEASKTVKMVLTGEGSDELLGGYPKHLAEQWGAYWRGLPKTIRQSIIMPAVQHLPFRFRRIKTAIASLSIEDESERMIRWFGAMSFEERLKLTAFRPPIVQSVDRTARVSPSSTLRRILCFDQTSWLPDNLLERGDRMTMAASIEARMPFLDQDLVAYVSGLPDKFRVRGMTTKWLLRKAMQNVLPSAILSKPKVGFRVPVNEWFRGPMRDWLLDHLLGAQSFTREYWQRDHLEQLLREHFYGHCNHEKLIWMLISLELWHKHCLERA